MDWLFSSIDVSFEKHPAKDLDLRCLVLRVKRQVGVIPRGPNSQPLKGRLLLVDGLHRELSGQLAQLDGGQRLSVGGLHRLKHLQLNGKTVAVPPWDEGCFPTAEELVAVDEILENFVQRMPHVDATVCIRRSVVKRVHLAGICFGELCVHLVRFPQVLYLRLSFDGVCPLIKLGARQIHGVLVESTRLLVVLLFRGSIS
mmetsp:Transcript_3825/g.11386  ORF Transcript_3825/g.11386 Transcript_3825/m.11386 type:complete len:200 (+) Transcript_3825:1949-2548(+)